MELGNGIVELYKEKRGLRTGSRPLGGGRRWGPGEAGRGPGRRGFRAAVGAQGGGSGGGMCECVSVGGRVYASGGLRPVVTYERYAECPRSGHSAN